MSGSPSYNILAAIDPSINCSGLAIFDGRRLVESYTVECDWKELPVGMRTVKMARAIIDHLDFKIDDLAVEWPAYQGDHSRPKDLAGLYAINCAISTYLNVPTAFYTPKQWCAGTRKSLVSKNMLTSGRSMRVLNRLNEAELEVFSKVKSHDEIDAVAIGLHHLGRFGAKRVFPGAGK